MNPVEILKRKRLSAAIVFCVLMSASAAKVFLYPVYQADALLMVDLKKGPTTVEVNLLDPNQMLSLVRVHSHLLQSLPVLRSVVLSLGLYRQPGPLGAPAASEVPLSAAEESGVRAAIQRLQQKSLVVVSPPFTNLIELHVRHRDPETAAAIANALLDRYLEWNVEFQHQELDRLLEYLEKETKAVKRRLEDAELALRDYKGQHKIADLSEEVRAYFNILPERFKSHYQVIQSQETKLLELEIERSRLRELYASGSPQIVYLGRTIDEVKAQLAGRIRQVDLGEDYLEHLKAVPQKEMMLARLMREQKIQDSLYTFLLDERERARLLKARQTVESVKIVARAQVPFKPAGRLKGLALGLAVSALMTALIIVGSEAARTPAG